MIKPKKLLNAAGSAIEVDGDILYIHKGGNYENVIYRGDNNIYYAPLIGKTGPGFVFGGLADDETINDISSVGNTLVVSTSKEMYYALWRDGAYKYLGNKIPIPNIYFRMGDLEQVRVAPYLPDPDPNTDPGSIDGVERFTRDGSEAPVFPHSSVGDSMVYGSESKRFVFDYSDYEGFWTEFLDVVWGQVDSAVKEQADNGKAVFPFFVRYAVRLYDGTSYAQSIPVLIGADIAKFIDLKGLAVQIHSAGGSDELQLTWIFSFLKLAPSFSLYLGVSGKQNIFDGWEDIVSGVDVYISPQMKPVQRNAAKLKTTFLSQTSGSIISRTYKITDFVLDPYYSEQRQEDLVLYYQSTHLAKSYTIDEFSALSGETRLSDINFSSDYILAQEPLKETSQSMHYSLGDRLFSYNNSLIMAGAKQKLYGGYPHLHSSRWVGATPQQWLLPVYPFRFVFYIRGDNGETITVSEAMPMKKAIVTGLNQGFVESPVAWIAYPDSRCYKVDIYHMMPEVSVVSFPMKAASQIDVAYTFLGFGVSPTFRLYEGLVPSGEGSYSMPNTLLVSQVNNPFIFPAVNSVTFSGTEVLNMAVATLPLSEGQFGQFPLYVFTDDGVFALSVDAEGKFRTSHPVSRDILSGRDALVGIEQGVFFASGRGLLLLRGSTVRKVSVPMDGVLSDVETPLMDTISENYLDGITSESQPLFNEYIKGCNITYDYANTRILMFRPGDSFLYVYKFDTDSWHRMKAGVGTIVRSLNAYPEAVVVTRVPEIPRNQTIYNFSVFNGAANSIALPGLIYLRDLMLDNADAYKTINRLKIRGRFKHGNVRWQLQGSNDGLNYVDLHSLRGPSWKWYRIILVTMLSPGERVSYIELDYDPRFMDKIR